MPILTADDGTVYDVPAHLLDPDADDNEPGFRKRLKAARDEAETAKQAAEERASAAERKLAFAEAGVPLNDPRSKYFVKGYEGELTAEAIQAEAAAFGLTAAPANSIQPAEATALNTMGQAGDGQAVPGAADFAAEYAAAAALPPREGSAKVAEIAARQGVQVLQ
jgi:hypothetical protein